MLKYYPMHERLQLQPQLWSLLFYTKQRGLLVWSWCTSLTRLIAGTRRIMTRTWSKVQVKNGVWSSIGFCISLGELLFEFRQKLLILLIKKLSFLPQPFILFHYVTVLVVQLWVQPFHDCENNSSPETHYSQCSRSWNQKKKKYKKESEQIGIESSDYTITWPGSIIQ